ncbi:MAG: pilus assembly protein PilM [Kiritimatiellae bacterium]|nr:pilus assembly protein PilM [Kiritimatiellia bacterium]
MVLLSRRHAANQVENIFIEEVLFESRINGKARPPLETARQLLIHKNLTGCKTLCVAPGATESCFVILPKMSKAEADSAILLQAKKIISWDIENPVVAFKGSEFLRDRVGYLVGLADWKAVKAWSRLIEGSGSLIDDITLGACAYQALSQAQGWADEFPFILVADLGASASSFYVLDRQAVRFMRKIPVGGDAITRLLMTEVSTEGGLIRLADSEAEDVKITGYLPVAGKKEPEYRSGPTSRAVGPNAESSSGHPATKQVEHVEMLVRPVVERITSEIIRSIQFFKDNVGQKVDAVFLTGGTAGLQVLRTHLETSSALPVRIINPFAGLTFANPGIQKYADKHKTRLAMATGLALAKQPALSLLPKAIQIMKRFTDFMPRLVAALLILGFVPLLVAGICQVVSIQSVRSETRQYQQQLQQTSQERQRLDVLQKQFQESSEYFHALKNMVGRNPLWPGILNALADALPPDIVLTRFDAGFDPGRPNVIILEGKVLPAAAGFDDAMAALLPALSASVFFKQVNIINAKAGSPGRLASGEPGGTESKSMLGTFEIQCELVH